ncbi:uncharacterized protein SCHCODRAFT_02623746 [Schizophyllum commune H4-8]|uniref:uncharacterized protein n=1 Tax=Schizophyllum commune (strain H4-8 / FGSC 9210) TaxID=578458 RepID=UPI00215FA098|nr:uncharacterized protein SCHCODRAFT_02623746 [Schizophyllum commune H4-8]KAI5894107.1 hypothetical protein SCHCODRAFT_02623746 [Schizophyllum commune H4-8]
MAQQPQPQYHYYTNANYASPNVQYQTPAPQQQQQQQQQQYASYQLNPYNQAPFQAQPPPRGRSSPDPVPDMTPELASKIMRRFIAREIKKRGFEGVENAEVLARFEREVAGHIQNIFAIAHEYANLSHRSYIAPPDVYQACQGEGLTTQDLRTKAKKRKRRAPVDKLAPRAARTPSPELLPSDDEDQAHTYQGAAKGPLTLRDVPSYLPKLPPKHTYLKSPPTSTQQRSQTMPSLEKKLKTASLVQDSLRHLMSNTEGVAIPEADVEGYVNWEHNVYGHTRKRWKVGSSST